MTDAGRLLAERGNDRLRSGSVATRTDVPAASKARLIADGAHVLGIEETYIALGTCRRGLSNAEARQRVALHGPNALPRQRPPGLLRVFIRQFRSPLVYILMIAGAVSGVMRDWSDAGFIFAVLIVNAIIGCSQEYGAQKSAEALRALTVSTARVVRDGEDYEVESRELVPGDVVLLEAGDKVAADVRLISGSGLELDESILTGESLSVTKNAALVCSPDTPVAERANMAFGGTLVTRGRGYAVVVATGYATQLGHIARSMDAAGLAKAPLLVRMDRFARRVAVAVGVTVVGLGAIALARGGSTADVFVLAVALAVSAIPEGLPVALSVALAIGARRMSQRRVIARRLVAVEALGSCTFIASDKTGTLTMNELTARAVVLPGENPIEVTGQGVNAEGRVLASEQELALVERLCTAASLCNDGFLGLRDGAWAHHGDAGDVALLALAAKVGISQAASEAATPRVAEIPFESERRFAATLHRAGDSLFAAVKGAGERVLPMCSRMATQSGDVAIDVARLERQAESLAGAGYRVLAIAAGPVVVDEPSELGPEHLSELVFLGFVGMIDPLRPEVTASVRACERAGIQVAMVTGDHPLTALAIARELGLADRPEQVVTGALLHKLGMQGVDAVDALVREARVFARVEPSQKLAIVESLIRGGHFVAVTGDGANDAPALRAAHIGVAMGQRGTDLARESAELIVTDDDFSSIVAGVEEGRVAYANVRKVVFLLVSSGAAEVFLFVLTTAAGLPPPLWPVQLLWLNLVTNGIQDIALAFEPKEGGELERPPRSPREPIFNRLMIERTVLSAAVMAVIGYFAYDWMLERSWPLAQAQNALLLLFVLFENIQAGNSRSETTSLFRMNPFGNRLLIGGTVLAQLVHIAAMYTPGLSKVLRIEPVSTTQWAITLGLALVVLLVAEGHKLWLRRRAIGSG